MYWRIPSLPSSCRTELRAVAKKAFALASRGAFSLEEINLMNSSAASFFSVNFGTDQPQPPAQVFAPPGPAGGKLTFAFSGLYHCFCPAATSQKKVHSRIVSSLSPV